MRGARTQAHENREFRPSIGGDIPNFRPVFRGHCLFREEIRDFPSSCRTPHLNLQLPGRKSRVVVSSRHTRPSNPPPIAIGMDLRLLCERIDDKSQAQFISDLRP